jgi:hypothetical protein
MEMQKKHVEDGIDLSVDAYNWAKKRMHDVDQRISDAGRRASAVHERTQGTAFERFGQHRVDNAQSLADDPPYGIAKVVQFGSMLLAAGLTLYSVIHQGKDSDSTRKA